MSVMVINIAIKTIKRTTTIMMMTTTVINEINNINSSRPQRQILIGIETKQSQKRIQYL